MAVVGEVLEMKMDQKLCPPIMEGGSKKLFNSDDYNCSIWDNTTEMLVVSLIVKDHASMLFKMGSYGIGVTTEGESVVFCVFVVACL